MIGSCTRLCCLIGDPVEHSLSPKMMNAAFRHAGKDCAYLAFKVEKGALKGAVNGLRDLSVVGCNVTIPHKVSVMPLLDKVDASAALSGSVNVISNQNGSLAGYNTDGFGAMKALEAGGAKLSGAKVLVLGYGGAARGISFEIAKNGRVCSIFVSGRSISRAQAFAKELSSLVPAAAVPLNRCREVRGDIIINCTPVGMWLAQGEGLLKAEDLESSSTVMDLVYNPPETGLMRAARSKGCRVIGGIEMLVQQGAKAFEIWFGEPAPIEVMRKAVSERVS